MEDVFLSLFGVKFNGDCTTYDRYKWLSRYLNRTKDNLRLLDVGCGNGWAIFMAAQRGYKATGLTFSEDDRDKILRRARKLNLDVEVLVHDARKLDELDVEPFDVVINAENIEHIINDEKLVHDIANLTKDRGLLYLTSPNLFHRLKGPGEDGPFERGVEDGWHVRRGYTHVHLARMMEGEGFAVALQGYITHRLSIHLLRVSRWLPNKLMKPITIPLTVICNVLDRIFFRGYDGSLSVYLIGQKLLRR